jgi:hypothetical protein
MKYMGWVLEIKLPGFFGHPEVPAGESQHGSSWDFFTIMYFCPSNKLHYCKSIFVRLGGIRSKFP